MERWELSYRRMLQLIGQEGLCRLCTVQEGLPCIQPACFCCRMDGCTPVFRLTPADPAQPLPPEAPALLVVEAPARSGALEMVTVRGRLLAADEGEGQPAARRTPAAARDFPAWEEGLHAGEGYVRFDTPGCDGRRQGARCRQVLWLRAQEMTGCRWEGCRGAAFAPAQ